MKFGGHPNGLETNPFGNETLGNETCFQAGQCYFSPTLLLHSKFSCSIRMRSALVCVSQTRATTENTGGNVEENIGNPKGCRTKQALPRKHAGRVAVNWFFKCSAADGKHNWLGGKIRHPWENRSPILGKSVTDFGNQLPAFGLKLLCQLPETKKVKNKTLTRLATLALWLGVA